MRRLLFLLASAATVAGLVLVSHHPIARFVGTCGGADFVWMDGIDELVVLVLVLACLGAIASTVVMALRAVVRGVDRRGVGVLAAAVALLAFAAITNLPAHLAVDRDLVTDYCDLSG